MNIVLLADVFPPLRSSGAVLVRDLALEWVRSGHRVTVMVPAPDQAEPWKLEDLTGVEVLRLRAAQTKDVGLVRRALAELTMPLRMFRHWRASPLRDQRWDGVVWYSPTIFLGPLAWLLKRHCRARGYLVLRDIFPEWAVDMGLMGRGLPYWFFKAVERFQYRVADVIGVQSRPALKYFASWKRQGARRVEVLQNWLADAPLAPCSIDVHAGPLAGRRVFVYAGNMGQAQGLDVVLDAAALLRDDARLGFLLVGRGTDAARLRERAHSMALPNVVFHDEIDPGEIPGLYAQCHAGLVILDPRHRTHNVPGKFLSYMWAGLAVLACVNRGNDLIDLIREEDVGVAVEECSARAIADGVLGLLPVSDDEAQVRSGRCRAVAARLYAPDIAARQIVAGLKP